MSNFLAFTILLVAIVAYAIVTARDDDGRHDDE